MELGKSIFDKKYFMTAAHVRFQCESFKRQYDGIVLCVFFFSISKGEQLRLVKINSRLKFQCRVADNNAYRAVRILYAYCMLKSEFL